MKKLSYSLIGLSFIATAAYAQPAPDLTEPLPSADAVGDPLAEPPLAEPLPAPAETVPAEEIPPAPADVTDPVPAEPLPAPADPLSGEIAGDVEAETTLPGEEPADALAGADATAGAAFSDTEIDSFAKATVKVQQIDADTTLDADSKQSQMAAAVNEAGLDAATYNEIGQALATDPELRAQVQTAMTRHAAPSDG